MENKVMIQNLIDQIGQRERINFISQEQYYFALGQALTAIFIKLGGIDLYRREFNFLTNPYLPLPIYDLAKRILKFLSKSKDKVLIADASLEKILIALFLSENEFITPKINMQAAEDAFYDGLHYDCLLCD